MVPLKNLGDYLKIALSHLRGIREAATNQGLTALYIIQKSDYNLSHSRRLGNMSLPQWNMRFINMPLMRNQSYWSFFHFLLLPHLWQGLFRRIFLYFFCRTFKTCPWVVEKSSRWTQIAHQSHFKTIFFWAWFPFLLCLFGIFLKTFHQFPSKHNFTLYDVCAGLNWSLFVSNIFTKYCL